MRFGVLCFSVASVHRGISVFRFSPPKKKCSGKCVCVRRLVSLYIYFKLGTEVAEFNKLYYLCLPKTPSRTLRSVHYYCCWAAFPNADCVFFFFFFNNGHKLAHQEFSALSAVGASGLALRRSWVRFQHGTIFPVVLSLVAMRPSFTSLAHGSIQCHSIFNLVTLFFFHLLYLSFDI